MGWGLCHPREALGVLTSPLPSCFLHSMHHSLQLCIYLCIVDLSHGYNCIKGREYTTMYTKCLAHS